MLGEKSGQGFYKRVKSGGESSILELDLKTLEYVPQQKVHYPSLAAARNQRTPAQRMLSILDSDDRASQLARETTASSLIYAATLAQEIAYSIVDVDNAMRWGFNFELGSFEIWDLLLQNPTILQKVLQDRPLPELVQRVQSKGQGAMHLCLLGWLLGC